MKLSEGDVFRFYLSDELLDTGGREKTADFREVPPDIDVIYEDENILLCDKPVGMVVHEDNDNTSDTLINRIKCYLWNQKIRDRELVKLYLCVVQGELPKRADTLTAYLEKLSDENRVIVSDRKTPQNRTILTKYRVLETRGGNSLLEVDLLTGRTHQIRAHFAHVGHPLLGDGKYGSNKLNKALGYDVQALYSYKLRFEFTTPAGCLEYLNHREFSVEDMNSIWFVKKFHGSD